MFLQEDYTGNCVQIGLGSREGKENVLEVQAKDPCDSELGAMEVGKKR